MESKRAPGGLDADDYKTSNAESNNTRRRGGAGPARRGIADATMLSRAMADATGSGTGGGAGASLSQRMGDAVPIKGRGALSVKGASGTTVEVRGLVKGTTADDVKVSLQPENMVNFRLVNLSAHDSGHPRTSRRFSATREPSSRRVRHLAEVAIPSQCTSSSKVQPVPNRLARLSTVKSLMGAKLKLSSLAATS